MFDFLGMVYNEFEYTTIISMLCVVHHVFHVETLVAYSVGSIVVLPVIWLGHMAVRKRWQ